MVEFRVLGSVEARREGSTIDVGGPKQRALLAILLLQSNTVVSRELLIDGLWGERPPSSASHTLNDYVSRLRKTIGDGRLSLQPPGYVLRVAPGELDLDRFGELMTEGEAAIQQGRIPEGAALFERALGLWRGSALGDASGNGFLEREADRLEELRLSAQEHLIESALALGRHGRLVPELERLVAAFPLRERFRAQLMLALYRAGRQADALDLYAQTREMLVEQLGLEPGAELRELQRRILVQDPTLRRLEPSVPEHVPTNPALARKRRSMTPVAIGAVLAVTAATAIAVIGHGLGRSLAGATSIAFLDARSGELRDDVAVTSSGAGVMRAGSRWLWDMKESGNLLQIDADTRRVVHTFPLGRTVGEFAVGEGALWFVATDSRTLIRFDVRYGLVTRRVSLSPEVDPSLGAVEDSADVVVADGSVWVAHGLAQVDRVDPVSGRVIHRFPIADASLVAAGHGAIWVASSDLGLLTKIDPRTDAIVATAHIRPWICCLAAGGGAVWASNNERIWKLSDDGELLDTIKTPSDTGGLAFGDGALWFTNDIRGTVTRVDPRSDATRDFRVGHLVTGLVAGRGLVAVDVSPTGLDLAAAVKGRVLQVRFSQDWIDDPDPAVGGAPGANEWPWLQQVLYATTARLLTYRDSRAPAAWKLVPEIAAGLPALSGDRRTYTFRIRHGFRFSPPSGQAVTAQTFKYSIERALSPILGDNAPAARIASDIVGVHAYRAGTAVQIAGVRAHGDTLTITLRRPEPDFPERMALSYFAPVPIGTPVVANGLRDPIPSAGPYYIAYNDGGVVGILRRNPYYHGERAHHLDAIVLTPQPDIAQDISAIESGSADYIAEPGPALSSGQFPGAGTPSAGEQRYFRSPLLGVDELAFNTVRGPLANARLRRAISYALDRPALAAALADRATDRLLPIGMPGYRATHVYPPAGPDLKRARALARDFRGSVSLEVCGQPSCLEIGRIVAADLARIGVSTFVRQYPGDLAPATTRPGADIVLARVFAPYPDPVAALRAELGSRYKARLDALAQLDRPQRLIAAGRLELDLLRRSAPIAAIGTPTIPELFSTRVGCKTFQPLFFGVDLAGLCLRR